MTTFIPDGYVETPEAVTIAIRALFSEDAERLAAALDKLESDFANSTARDSDPIQAAARAPQVPLAVREEIERMRTAASRRLRGLLHSGKLRAVYFGHRGLESVPAVFWAQGDADGVLEAGWTRPMDVSFQSQRLFVERSELEKILKPNAEVTRRGPKPKNDWEDMQVIFNQEVQKRGFPKPSNTFNWSTLADVERWIAGHLQTKGSSASESTIRGYAKRFMAEADDPDF